MLGRVPLGSGGMGTLPIPGRPALGHDTGDVHYWLRYKPCKLPHVQLLMQQLTVAVAHAGAEAGCWCMMSAPASGVQEGLFLLSTCHHVRNAAQLLTVANDASNCSCTAGK